MLAPAFTGALLLLGSLQAVEPTRGRPDSSAAAMPAVPGVPSDSAAPRPRSWVLLPTLFSTPETGLAGGALVGYYHRGGLGPRPSSVLTALTLTSKRQVVLETYPEIRLREGTLRMEGEARAARYPDVFYGVGNRTTEAMEEDFTSRHLRLRVDVQTEVAAEAWLGIRLALRHEELSDVEKGGLLAAGGVLGSEGGLDAGLGPVVLLDRRDNRFSARTGVYASAALTWHGAALAGDYAYSLLVLDLRGYRTLGGRVVVAGRAQVEAAGGDPPFGSMPRLGGPSLLRGYREGRFRDRRLAVLEGEVRFPIAWRFGGVVFAGVGDVAHDAGDVPALRELERALGLGVRFRMNDAGVRLRADGAWGREGGGLYLSVGEAF